MNRNLVSSAVVRKWLTDEEENIKPYVRAWHGANPYNSLSHMKFCFWSMVVSIVLTISVAMVGPRNGTIMGSVIVMFFFFALYGWWETRKELKKFCSAVVWCEYEAIPEHCLLRSRWTKDDIHEVLSSFARIIRADILPLEQECKENYLFPRKRAKARKLHDSIKARLAKEIKMISPMFNHFHGVDNPLGEAFRIAQEQSK